MKKFFVTMMIAFIAMGVKAQTTSNLRIGGGIYRYEYEDYYDSYNDYTESEFRPIIIFETNIPFNKTSRFTFSPSFSVSSNFEEDYAITIPLHLGYKIPLSNKTLVFPKLGGMIGYSNREFIAGPSAELALETHHFITALNGYVSLVDGYMPVGIFLTLGCKF